MNVKYGIFKTKWGYFGIAGTETGICRTCLPVESRNQAKNLLCDGFKSCREDESAFSGLKMRITSYFEGQESDFGPITFDLSSLSAFGRAVLEECSRIPSGSAITYSELAKRLNNPKAMRAVGGALARNPVPLLIPCHRVIRSDGGMGGFSAIGGIGIKERLLHLERTMACETVHA